MNNKQSSYIQQYVSSYSGEQQCFFRDVQVMIIIEFISVQLADEVQQKGGSENLKPGKWYE